MMQIRPPNRLICLLGRRKSGTMPNMSQSDTPCKEGAAYASNIREAEQNDSLRQQLRAEQIVNTDLARHKPNGLYSAPQEMVNVSESNHGIHEPLQAINPDIQQPTNNDVELFVQADVPDDVAPMAKENEEIVIHYPPEVQQFTAIDFPVLLFVSLPGYGYASLGIFPKLRHCFEDKRRRRKAEQ
ncbi:hypothetical protein IW261DRAFT_479505 [Armillaria novae-zelandiae]|uniref:Uncharacterized protein n=1 Tax=Armillaria novae-zelandiae TaxID=153914 RepID=A0AA39P0S9_9AGAR|nr:hypothetical protein IW261DRAFT_479505 [Armillaria novae-zelandiae]